MPSMHHTTSKMSNIQLSQWWNWDDEQLQDIENLVEDIDGVIEKWGDEARERTFGAVDCAL